MFKSLRINRAMQQAYQQWNGFALTASDPQMAAAVRSRLRSTQIVAEDGDILVTQTGFVTLAIHADQARLIGKALVAPGIDNNGQRGHLVLRDNAHPYHSRAESAARANTESLKALLKADSLLTTFGDKFTLREAAKQLPWHTLINQADCECSGLCLWGTESFLRRFGLLTIARRFGVPRALLKLAGPYGDRASAARALRDSSARLRAGTTAEQAARQRAEKAMAGLPDAILGAFEDEAMISPIKKPIEERSSPTHRHESKALACG